MVIREYIHTKCFSGGKFFSSENWHPPYLNSTTVSTKAKELENFMKPIDGAMGITAFLNQNINHIPLLLSQGIRIFTYGMIPEIIKFMSQINFFVV